MNNSILKLFSVEPNIRLQEIISKVNYPSVGLHKCRILYGSKDYKIEICAYKPRKIESLILHVDNEIEYSLKYSDRENLNRMKKGFSPSQEVMIIKNGFLTDTSYTNIILKRRNQWYTPLNPLLSGVQRQKLIDMGKVIPISIPLAMIQSFDEISLINSMIDFDRRMSISLDQLDYSNL